MRRFTVLALCSLIVSAWSGPARAQSLLVTPRLETFDVPPAGVLRDAQFLAALQSGEKKAIDPCLLQRVREAAALAAAQGEGEEEQEDQGGERHVRIPGLNFGWVGSLTPECSESVWRTNTQSGLLSGASLGVGSGRAAVFTELGNVLSGPWRWSVGTTLSVSTGEGEATETDEEVSALSRFIEGGGNLAVHAARPLVIAEVGRYAQGGLFLTPRAWVNVPTLSSAEGVQDYGGDISAAVVLQRNRNNLTPFLTLELRGGWVMGSDDFYGALGRDSTGFLYFAPTLKLSIVDRVEVEASTFVGEGFTDTRGVTVGLSFRSARVDERGRDGLPQPAPAPAGPPPVTPEGDDDTSGTENTPDEEDGTGRG